MRRLRPADSNDLLEFMAHEESFRYIDAKPIDLEAVEDWIKKDQSNRYVDTKDVVSLVMELRGEQKVIGHLNLYYLYEDER